MVVVTLTDCPPRLRGDLSKWLQEIDTGVYVGRVSRRVRDELWERICQNLPRGRATMVYPADNEQRMEFRVHNTVWQPVDFEGITLMRRPLTVSPDDQPKPKPSNAAAAQTVSRIRSAQSRAAQKAGYVVIDIETTGTDPQRDTILELGAIRVIDHKVAETFSAIVRPAGAVPDAIAALTGLTDDIVQQEGIDRTEALERFWLFVGQGPILGHNLTFDLAFLQKESREADLSVPRLPCRDTLTLARRRVEDIADHRLATLAAYFGIEPQAAHRAVADCITTFRVYEKLNEI